MCSQRKRKRNRRERERLMQSMDGAVLRKGVEHLSLALLPKKPAAFPPLHLFNHSLPHSPASLLASRLSLRRATIADKSKTNHSEQRTTNPSPTDPTIPLRRRSRACLTTKHGQVSTTSPP